MYVAHFACSKVCERALASLNEIEKDNLFGEKIKVCSPRLINCCLCVEQLIIVHWFLYFRYSVQVVNCKKKHVAREHGTSYTD